jgi:hypothetical protein
MSRMTDLVGLARWVLIIVFVVLFALPIAAAAFFALLSVYRSTVADERELRILARETEVWQENRRYRKGRGSALVPVVTKSLTLAGNGQTFHHKVTRDLDQRGFFSEAFLHEYRPGETVWVTVSPDGRSVELETGIEKKKALGLGAIILLLGWFAWMLWPAVTSSTEWRMGLKFAVAGFAMIAGVGFALYNRNREETITQQIRRYPVSCTMKSMPLAQALGEIEAKGVKLRPDVKSIFNDPVRYCEYEFQGQTWRATSPSGLDGTVNEGRVNPANPHDVIWAGQSM